MPVDERWDRMGPADWDAFVQAWLAELNLPEVSETSAGFAEVMTDFTAKPEHRWRFIQAAVAQAVSDKQLGHIAGGPMERLLGRYGAEYISLVEEQANADPKFARMLLGVWKYMMTDEIWERVRALKARHADLAEPPTPSE